MSTIVVVVFGNKGAGKDTFSDLLAEAFRSRDVAVRRTAFAEPLKLAAHHLLGIPLEVSNGPQEVKDQRVFYGKTCRYWLQWLGTDVGRRQVAEGLWVDRACDLIDRAPEPVAIVSDGRFRNELAGPVLYFGPNRVTSILVRRPGLPPPSLDDHPSEREVYELALEHQAGGVFDHVVWNEGTIRDLGEHANALAARIVANERAFGGALS